MSRCRNIDHQKLQETIETNLRSMTLVKTGDAWQWCQNMASYTTICKVFRDIMECHIQSGNILRLDRGKYRVLPSYTAGMERKLSDMELIAERIEENLKPGKTMTVQEAWSLCYKEATFHKVCSVFDNIMGTLVRQGRAHKMTHNGYLILKNK